MFNDRVLSSGDFTSVTAVKFDEKLLVALSGLLDTFPDLTSVCANYNLSLFTVLSAPMIENLDRLVGSNQSLLYEGVEFCELVEQLSLFYSDADVSYVDLVVERIIRMRIVNTENMAIIAGSTMDEYFMGDADKLKQTLKANPFLLGVYLFVMVKKMVRYGIVK